MFIWHWVRFRGFILLFYTCCKQSLCVCSMFMCFVSEIQYYFRCFMFKFIFSGLGKGSCIIIFWDSWFYFQIGSVFRFFSSSFGSCFFGSGFGTCFSQMAPSGLIPFTMTIRIWKLKIYINLIIFFLYLQPLCRRFCKLPGGLLGCGSSCGFWAWGVSWNVCTVCFAQIIETI